MQLWLSRADLTINNQPILENSLNPGKYHISLLSGPVTRLHYLNTRTLLTLLIMLLLGCSFDPPFSNSESFLAVAALCSRRCSPRAAISAVRTTTQYLERGTSQFWIKLRRTSELAYVPSSRLFFGFFLVFGQKIRGTSFNLSQIYRAVSTWKAK